ncbi:MAG: hypothetical protein M3O33_06840 [Cyanobacteriota bacterium]|nr:hypothetical protein [Cyanobacteriota bacterium]
MEEINLPIELLEVASKRDDPNYQQISGHIPKEMATEFKVACTRKGVSHSDGLEQAIALWLAQDNQPLASSTSSGKGRGKKGGEE